MTKKRIKLPKEGFIEADEPATGGSHLRLRDDDVEGHSFAIPAPPSVRPPDLMPSRSPSQGGELTPGDDDDGWKGLNDR
jgi:hypothetical protein